MESSSSVVHHIEDLGRILLHTETELKRMSENLRSGSSAGDVSSVLERAQSQLHKKARIVLDSVMRNSIKTREDAISTRYFSPMNTTNTNMTTTMMTRQNNKHSPLSNAGRAVIVSEAVTKQQNKKRTKKKKKKTQRQIHTTSTTKKQLENLNDLQTRGIIPKNADLSLASSSLLDISRAQITSKPQSSSDPQTTIRTSDLGFSLSQLKLDVATTTTIPTKKEKTPRKHENQNENESMFCSSSVISASSLLKTPSSKTSPSKPYNPNESFADTIDKIRGYSKMNEKYSTQQLVVRDGMLLRSTPDFKSFRRLHRLSWGPIASVLNSLERLLKSHAIPVAYLDGRKISEIAQDELIVPSTNELVSCIDNLDDVQPLLRVPGRRYAGPEGETAAALLLQSTFRKHKERAHFLLRRAQNKCAQKLLAIIKCASERRRMLERLQVRSETRSKLWNKIQMEFQRDWSVIKSRRHVVIHVPSISISVSQRLSMKNFSVEQNRQMGTYSCCLIVCLSILSFSHTPTHPLKQEDEYAKQ